MKLFRITFFALVLIGCQPEDVQPVQAGPGPADTVTIIVDPPAVAELVLPVGQYIRDKVSQSHVTNITAPGNDYVMHYSWDGDRLVSIEYLWEDVNRRNLVVYSYDSQDRHVKTVSKVWVDGVLFSHSINDLTY